MIICGIWFILMRSFNFKFRNHIIFDISICFLTSNKPFHILYLHYQQNNAATLIMGNICSQDVHNSSTHNASNLTAQFTCVYEFDSDYDNPKRQHLSSKFLQTNFDASNHLLQDNSFRITNRQTSAFWNDTSEGDKEKEMEIVKKKTEDLSKNRLPSVKICYGDFVSISRKKIEEKYRIIERIGAGAFGEVFKAQNQSTGELKAIKIFKKHEIDKHRQQIQILKQCDHPNIVQIYQIFEQKNSWHVVMEYCQGGSIINLIKNKKYLYLEDQARSILEQILRALIYLHGKGIIHRDIKLENVVFIEPSPGQNITSNLKLIDFGNAERVKFKVNRTSSMGGTTMYMPPQAFSGWYSSGFDIWSCGVLLCILLTGYCPFKKNKRQQIIDLIKNKEVDFKDARWSKISEQAKDLTRRMLSKDFMKRPTAQQCLQSPWFQNSLKRSQLRKASERFTKNLTKYYAINNFVSVVESYLSFLKISQSQKNEIKLLFQAIDVRRQGHLSNHDILESYQGGFVKQSEERIKKLIEAIDKNKSGYIDYSQFQTVMCNRKKLFTKQSLQNAFDYFDYDGSGFIEKNQLISCLKDSEADVQNLIVQIDHDHDAKISKQEFIKYFEKIQKQLVDDQINQSN